MKKQLLMQLIMPIAAFMYAVIFWKEGWGLNILLVSCFWPAVLFLFRREVFQSQAVKAATLGLLFSATMVVINNNAISKVAHVFSLAMLVGFAQAEWLRFIVYALLLTVISLIESPLAMIRHFFERESRRILSFWQLSYFIVPFFIGFLFFIIYYNANATFAHVTDLFFSKIFSWNWIHFSPVRLILAFVGAALAFVLCFPSARAESMESQEATHTFGLKRRRSQFHLFRFGPLALRREYRLGLFLLVGLNGLLLLANLADITTVWVGITPYTPAELSMFVHEGTYLLIYSILLAAGVVLFLFRGNLNFFPDNEPLKRAAGAWIIQNGFLALSVGLRNYHYIHQYGLAGNRIGVLFFLLLTGIGLITLFRKIMLGRSMYYLFFHNAWAWFWVCLVAGAVNWDVFITRYNLKYTADQLDVSYLAKDLSDKNLFLLLENKEKIFKLPNVQTNYDAATVEDWINTKTLRFKEKVSTRSWLSWNWPDERNKQWVED